MFFILLLEKNKCECFLFHFSKKIHSPFFITKSKSTFVFITGGFRVKGNVLTVSICSQVIIFPLVETTVILIASGHFSYSHIVCHRLFHFTYFSRVWSNIPNMSKYHEQHNFIIFVALSKSNRHRFFQPINIFLWW